MPRQSPLRRIMIALDPATRRIRAALARLAPRLPAANRMLDLGSGGARGPYAELFRHGQCVTADLFARAQVRSNAMALPFPDRTYDLVLCTEVLEHVADPDRALAEMHRVLAPAGALVLTTPLTWGVHEAVDYHRWTDQGLRQLLARSEFEIEVLEPRGGILLCLGAMLQAIPWQLFGSRRERNVFQSILFGLSYAVILPVALILAALDRLDRRRHFTHGYVVLARPSTSR